MATSNAKTTASEVKMETPQHADNLVKKVDKRVDNLVKFDNPVDNLVNIDKKPSVKFENSVENVDKIVKQSAESAAALSSESDSAYYDYSPFVAKEYWEKAIALKRNIKNAAKKLRAEQQALKDHFAKMENFFTSKYLEPYQ